MRKFSKILACILAVVLLLGTVAVSVSALGYDSSENQQLTLANLENSMIVANADTTYPSVNDFETNSSKGRGSAPSYGTYTHVSVTDANENVINKYIQYSHDANSAKQPGAGTSTTNYNTDWYGGARNYSSAFGFWQYDFATYEIDIGTDKYKELQADGSYILTDSPVSSVDGTTANDLAYPDTLSLQIWYRANGKNDGYGASNTITISKVNGLWCLNAAGVNFPLSQEVGVFNHITILFEINNDITYTTSNGEVTAEYDADIISAIVANDSYTDANGVVYTDFNYNFSKTKFHYYVDGVHVGSHAPIGTGADSRANWNATTDTANPSGTRAENFGHQQVRFTIQRKSFCDYTTGISKAFSLAYDNVTSVYYKQGYDGDLAKHDLTMPLFLCNDVVYKGDYNSPNPSSAYVYEEADYSELDPVKEFDLSAGAIDYAVENGIYAVITKSIHNYAPHATPDQFHVKCENGAEFTLAEGCGYYISGIDENGYTVVRKSQEVYACWFLTEEAYENFETDSDDTLLVGDSCVIADELLPGDEYLGNGQTKSIIGWQYTYTFGGEFTAFDGDPIVTIEMYNEIAALTEAGEEAALIIMPIYEIKDAYFSVTDNTTEEIAFYYLESDFKSVLHGISGNKTVVLFKDILVDANETSPYITPASGTTLNIDLNGHALVMYNAANNSRLFKFRANTSYKFYSSTEKATLALGDGRLIDSPDTGTADGCKLELNNLNVYAGQLIYTPPAGESKTVAQLDIVDCSIYVTARIIGVRNNWVVNITNTEIGVNSTWTSSGYSMFATNNANATMTVNITGSTLLGTKAAADRADYTIFNITDGSVANVTIANSTVSSNSALIVGEAESITIDDGSTLAFASKLPDYATAAEGKKLVAVNTGLAIRLTGLVVSSNATGELSTVSVNYANAPYEYVVVPEATEVVGAISGILANITTGNGFWVNFYIPTSLGLEADATYNGTTMIGGVEYAVYTVKGISPTSTAKAVLPIKVATVGETVYYRNATISIPDYFTAVLADAEVTEAEKALVANAANYCNELYKISNAAGYSVYNTIVTEYADYLIAAPEFESVGTVTSTDVVSQAQIIIAPGNVPMFAFTKVADATVTVGYTDIYGEAATADCTVMTHGEVEYYVVAEMHAYDMIGTITVYVNGTEALTYSLGDYINSLDPEADATTISIAKALYSYAKAVINFKKS